MHAKPAEVLLVVHDAIRREWLKDRLNREGYRIVTADNGASGLLRLHAEKPALVVVDATMPVMNGYQMLSVMRSDPLTRQVPAFLLTPNTDDHEIARGWMEGADLCVAHTAIHELIFAVARTLSPGRATAGNGAPLRVAS